LIPALMDELRLISIFRVFAFLAEMPSLIVLNAAFLTNPYQLDERDHFRNDQVLRSVKLVKLITASCLDMIPFNFTFPNVQVVELHRPPEGSDSTIWTTYSCYSCHSRQKVSPCAENLLNSLKLCDSLLRVNFPARNHRMRTICK